MLNFLPARVIQWLDDVFYGFNQSRQERILRLLEEAIELAQAENITEEKVDLLKRQVYDKPIGVIRQEVGGVLVTLAAYLAVTNQDPTEIFQEELTRIETPEMKQKIREKHKKKLVVSDDARRFYEGSMGTA